MEELQEELQGLQLPDLRTRYNDVVAKISAIEKGLIETRAKIHATCDHCSPAEIDKLENEEACAREELDRLQQELSEIEKEILAKELAAP